MNVLIAAVRAKSKNLLRGNNVQDYVLAEITGIDSETTELCGYCDAPIRIVRDAPDKYFVEAEE